MPEWLGKISSCHGCCSQAHFNTYDTPFAKDDGSAGAAYPIPLSLLHQFTWARSVAVKRDGRDCPAPPIRLSPQNIFVRCISLFFFYKLSQSFSLSQFVTGLQSPPPRKCEKRRPFRFGPFGPCSGTQNARRYNTTDFPSCCTPRSRAWVV